MTIQEQLREKAAYSVVLQSEREPTTGYDDWIRLCTAAADRIDHLEAALRDIAVTNLRHIHTHADVERLVIRARNGISS